MATTKKKWRGRATYEKLLEQRAREGLTFPDLSERSGVPVGTLQRWGRRLFREKSSAAQDFVEVVAVPDEAPETRIEVLLCSGRTMYLPAARPFSGLDELVRLLESC